MTQIDIKTIDKVRDALTRYYDGSLSVSGEKQLKSFFEKNGDSLPEDLAEEARLFMLVNDGAPEASELHHFAEKCIDNMVKSEPQSGAKISFLKHRYWFGGTVAAAVLLLIIIVGNGLRYENENLMSSVKTAKIYYSEVDSEVAEKPDTVTEDASNEYLNLSENEQDRRVKSSPGVEKYTTKENPRKEEAIDNEEKYYIEVTDSEEAVRLIEYAVAQLVQQREHANEVVSTVEPLLIDNIKMAGELQITKVNDITHINNIDI